MSAHGSTQAKILDGIDYMVLLAKDRLTAALEELNVEGDFDAAYDRTAEALDKLKPLAFAQNHIARWGENYRMIRVEELQEGMTLVNWGVVEGIESIEQPGHDGHCYNVTFEGESREPVHVHDGMELVIQIDGA